MDGINRAVRYEKSIDQLLPPSSAPSLLGHVVDPFDVRCETCRARLRVRDERVIGQIHACPKCGSMVHIAAPAGWVMSSASEMALAGVATGVVASPFGSESGVMASAASTQPVGLLARFTHSPAIRWSAGGVALLSLAGLGAAFAWNGITETAIPHAQSLAVDTSTAMPPATPNDKQPDSGVCAGLAAAMDAQSQIEFPADESAGSAEAPQATAQEPFAKPIEPARNIPTQSEVVATGAAVPEKPFVIDSNRPVNDATAAASTSTAPRTLKLEPISADSSPVDSTTPESIGPQNRPQYPPVPENADATAQVDESSQVSTASRQVLRFGPTTQDAAHRTNVADQVAMPIKSFQVSDVPLNRVLDMLANMAAVPISVDPSVLTAAGVSLDTKVAVHAHDLTLGKILGSVLREHNLACEVRDGQLAIIGRPGDASASAK
jgi:hypothetical protein